MFSRHEEATGAVAATMHEVFSLLDDPTLRSTHRNERSWKMGWGKLTTILDEQWGRVVGSHAVLRGRALGMLLFLDEIVIEREVPRRKVWETVGEPRLLAIGRYRMGFDITPSGSGVLISASIDYELPSRGLPRRLGYFFGRVYAKWCTRQMVVDAQALLAKPRRSAAALPSRLPPMREVRI